MCAPAPQVYGQWVDAGPKRVYFFLSEAKADLDQAFPAPAGELEKRLAALEAHAVAQEARLLKITTEKGYL